ncbi:hypothetical protein J1D01_05275 [Seonamhaeicola sp. NFXS20]|uniref:hypothetical protein n=1 Tax=Seonamhaeicola sp. NFXS20 TaxID=2816959 RepID=UPI003B8D5BAB
MKAKFTYPILLITILIFCSCVTDENEILLNKNSQYSNKALKPQFDRFILSEYNIFHISDFDNDNAFEFSNLIIGEEF